jgi:ATP/maltotriose-dependent transcriptional regulator MalT
MEAGFATSYAHPTLTLGAADVPAGFVGRAHEIAALRDTLDEVTAGAARVVEITGEPGIGKSRLLAELARQAEDRGLLVLSAQAFESDRYVPMAPLLDAFDDHRELLGHSLGTMVPDVDAANIHKSHSALRRFMEEIATSDPNRCGLAVLLDDMNQADDTTIKLLAQLVRRMPKAPVLLVVAYRQRQAPVLLSAAVTDADTGSAVRRLPLGGLTVAEVDQLLGSRGSPSWRRSLHMASGGNPFYLLALARNGAGTIESPADELSSIAQISLMREVESASRLAREVADAAAVAGEVFEPGILGDITGHDVPEVMLALDELVRLDLVRPVGNGQRFVFRHALILQAVYASISPGRRLSAHATAAKALRRRGASPAVLAYHVEPGGVPGDLEAVMVLQRAAAASAPHAPLTSAHWLRAALRLLPDNAQHIPRRVALLVRLAEALGRAGQLRASRDVMHEALRLLPRQATIRRARAVAFCVLIERLLCRRAEADAMLRAELETMPTDNHAVRASLLFELACSELASGQHARCAEIAAEALNAARQSRHRMRSTDAATLGVLAIANAAMADTGAARVLLDEAATLLDSMLDGEFVRNIGAALWVVWGEVLLERWDDALRHLDRSISFAQRTGEALALPHLYVKQVLVLRAKGRLVEAKECAQDAVDLALAYDGGEQLASALTMLCWVDVHSGDFTEGVGNGSDAATDPLKLLPSDFSNTLANRMLAEARLAAGDASGCLDMVAVAGGPDLCAADLCARPAWCEIMVRAAIAVGRADEARTWADKAEAAAALLDLPGRTGLALLARAQVLAARKPDEALAKATASAAILESAGLVFDATRAHMVAALAMAALGRIDEASAGLRAAESAYERFGAQGMARQAMRERRRIAAQGPRRGRTIFVTGLDTLTRRERQVASLVSEGFTNKRIAQELFVTEKTIEMHLANVFAKLRVSSRAAVARLVGAESSR